jgi:DNA-binding winged helix-turn-helix (wHTH) protein
MYEAFTFGPFCLQPGLRVLRKGSAEVRLGSRALDMLVALVEHAGTVLTHRELMGVAWPDLVVEESNVRVQVSNLRRALGCGRDGLKYISSVAARGYCFVAEVHRSGADVPKSQVTSRSSFGVSAYAEVPVSEGSRPDPGSLPDRAENSEVLFESSRAIAACGEAILVLTAAFAPEGRIAVRAVPVHPKLHVRPVHDGIANYAWVDGEIVIGLLAEVRRLVLLDASALPPDLGSTLIALAIPAVTTDATKVDASRPHLMPGLERSTSGVAPRVAGEA